MRYSPHIFLLFSAIAYSLPFIAAPSFWLLIFLLPPLLFLSVHTNKVPWHAYLAWSLAISTIHLLPLGNAIIYMTSAPLYLQLLPILLLIIYVGLHPFLFLLGMGAIFHRSNLSPFLNLLIWTVGWWVYLLYAEYALFWPFGRWEGYIFLSPLLPLTMSPSLLSSLHWIGLPAMLLFYCITTSAVYWWFCQRTVPSAVLLFLCTVAWLAPHYVVPSHPKPPPWIQQIGRLPMILPKTMPTERGSMVIAHEIKQLAAQQPELCLMVLPESSWNGLPLNTTCKLPALATLPVAHVLIGSFSLQNGIHHNSLYWFKNGQLQGRFDKCHAVPFVERIPWGGQLPINSLFFKDTSPICPSGDPKTALSLGNDLILVPYICSELFCSNNPYDSTTTHPILAVCNDWWFDLSYFRHLMLMGAQLRAIQWNRPIVYLSFYYAQFIDSHGTIHPLSPKP